MLTLPLDGLLRGAWVALAVLGAACTSELAAPPDASAPDAAPPDQDGAVIADAGVPSDARFADGGGDSAAPDGGPPAWLSRSVTLDDHQILIEKVSYLSDGLRVWGQVCRPRFEGPYPVIVFNHGGFVGLGREWNGGFCEMWARDGHVVIESSYRGEDGSDGEVEVCLGEVDDVLHMLEIGLAQPYVDPSRVFMMGGSHGGCITLRAVAAGAPVQAAAQLAAPTDWAATHAFLQESIDSGTLPAENEAFLQSIIDTLETAMGGAPSEVPAAYAARSPIEEATLLAEWPHPLFHAHGITDGIVPVSEACTLALAIGGAWAYRKEPSGALSSTTPSTCEGVSLSGPPHPAPGWTGRHFLGLYDEAGHGHGPGWAQMWADVESFRLARTPD